MVPPGSKRYAYIDFLRGLAALFVVYQHTAEVAVQSAIPNSLEQTIANFFTHTMGIGEIGVCVFLMISGFVVPFSLRHYSALTVKKFLIHRFFRLYPAYWISVVLGVITVWWRFGPTYGGKEIEWYTAAINLTMFQSFFGVTNIMGHYWTLTLELFFYAACVGLFIGKKLQSEKAILAFFIAFLLFRDLLVHRISLPAAALQVLFYLRFSGYMFFGLLYRKWLLQGDKSAGRYAAALLLITFMVFANRAVLHPLSTSENELRSAVAQFSAILIFLLCTYIYRPDYLIGNFLGKISYSLYLFHPVVFYPLYLMLWPQLPKVIQIHTHLFVLFSLVLVVPVSWLAYRYIEEPAIDFGRELARQTDDAVLAGARI
jgi:peptidoglycan/LPS O-acetylase OafA/YrhL